MNSAKRPIEVLLLSCLYIAVGTIGFVVNFPKLTALQHESIWIELTELLALIAGAFMFRGRNWARWLALVVDCFPNLRLQQLLRLSRVEFPRVAMPSAFIEEGERDVPVQHIETYVRIVVCAFLQHPSPLPVHDQQSQRRKTDVASQLSKR